MANKLVHQEEAKKFLSEAGKEFAVIQNPNTVFPKNEVIPLADRIENTVDSIKAVVMDMDGTTTTTEDLCLHSLEFMVRKMSGKLNNEQWHGLDNEDYPNVIGNSTTKHVEYLVRKYESTFNQNDIAKSFIYAAIWTIQNGKDEKRKSEVVENCNHLDLGELIETPYSIDINDDESVKRLTNKYNQNFNDLNFSDLVRIGIDIYYQKYHEILADISNEKSNRNGESLIKPMPGVSVFLPLIKGFLGEAAEKLTDLLVESLDEIANSGTLRKNLKALGEHFAKKPVKLAIVTSSIYYEANIVLQEVFKVLREEIKSFRIDENLKTDLLEKFSNYENIYDAVITASDAHEMRLKPHRDLYSIALEKLGVSNKDFDKVLGMEDSESGTIAIRAAGVGLCVALPFAQTSQHNLDAAAFICKQGLPEVIAQHNCFLNLE